MRSLRAKEKKLSKAMAQLDMKMTEKERSNEYQEMLSKVLSQFRITKETMDLMTMKDFLQLVFKRIIIKDRKIVDMDL